MASRIFDDSIKVTTQRAQCRSLHLKLLCDHRSRRLLRWPWLPQCFVPPSSRPIALPSARASLSFNCLPFLARYPVTTHLTSAAVPAPPPLLSSPVTPLLLFSPPLVLV
eukprot:Sspe_Gene.10614::Locus_3553_Transcript_1_1_Confidence_1.000_Length_2465::g.10614::m.10614